MSPAVQVENKGVGEHISDPLFFGDGMVTLLLFGAWNWAATIWQARINVVISEQDGQSW